MSMFFDAIKNHIKNIPESVAISDELGNAITYRELDILSAKVYAYLNARGIGKEKTVLIFLPRSAYIPAAMMGIVRAGAAYCVLEDDAPKDRVEFIKKDCGSALTIDKDGWKDILNTNPLFDWEDADEHNIITAAYTSGTTGTPKGVLLERGILDLNALSSAVVEEAGGFHHGDTIAINFPLNFIVFTICFGFFYMGGTLHILSNNTSRDIGEYVSYINKIRPEALFLIPSLFKSISGKLPQSVRTVFLGGEIAEDIPAQNGIYAINIYSATEIGYVSAYSFADGRKGALPLGKQITDGTVKLIGNDGNEAPASKQGEIYIKTPFTRGYIGLEEETKERFKDGYFRTGDIGIKDENGEIVCFGRSDEMIKINGKRVEPEETLAVFRAVTGIKESYVKGFSREKNGYLCVYYQGDEISDKERIIAEMAKKLPYYMLPAFFVRMDALPRVANGKIDRKKLEAPDISALQKIYLAPSDETENKLCDAFSKVFGIEKVGVLDDFVSLGGNSLSAFEIETEADITNFSVRDLFDCGSISEIAERLRKRNESKNEETPNEKKSFPLTAAQEYYLKWQLALPDSAIYNLSVVITFDAKLFDADKIASALEKAIKAHPALLTCFYKDGDLYRQKYDASLFRITTPKKVSDKYIENRIKAQPKPFIKPLEPLYKAEILKTEKTVYMFFDVSHLVFDGMSFGILFCDMMKAYKTEEIREKDDYLGYLESSEKAQSSAHYRESLEYFESFYDIKDYAGFPKSDFDKADKTAGRISVSLDGIAEKIEVFKRKRNITSNGFFIFVSLLAMSFYNKDKKVFLNWLYNSRNERSRINSIGLYNEEFPIKLEFAEDAEVSKLLASAGKQITSAIACSDCGFGYIDPTESVSFIYQKDVFSNAFYDKEGIGYIDLAEKSEAVDNDFNIEIIDDENGLSLGISYDSSEYLEESAKRFANVFIAAAEYLAFAEHFETLTVKDVFSAICRKTDIRPKDQKR